VALIITVSSSLFSTGNVSPYTAAPTYTPGKHSLIVCFVASIYTITASLPSSVTGHGLSYTRLSQTGAIGSSVLLNTWVVDSGTSPTSAATVVTQGGSPTGCFIVEYEITGADLSVSASAAIAQQATNSSNSTSVALTTPMTQTVAGSLPMAWLAHNANEATTGKAGWTVGALATGNIASPNLGGLAEYKTTWDGDPNATWVTSGLARILALEVLPGANLFLPSTLTATGSGGPFFRNPLNYPDPAL
jgi:hypothetical protein